MPHNSATPPSLVPQPPCKRPAHAPHIALEILDMIIDHIKALPREDGRTWQADIASFRLVARAFEAACRLALFHSISITVDKKDVKDSENPKRLAALLDHSPDLTTVIQVLTFHLVNHTTITHSNDKSLASALSKLEVVKEVRFHGSDGTQPCIVDTRKYAQLNIRNNANEALISILKGKQMKKLVLRDVRIPALVLAECTGVEVLEAYESCLWEMEADLIRNLPCPDPDPEGLDFIMPSYTNYVRPKTFVYTGRFTMDEFMQESYPELSPLRWDRLETLRLPYRKPGAFHINILNNALHLRNIELATFASGPFQPMEPTDPPPPSYESPLRHLPASSYSTLTHLSLLSEFDVWVSFDWINDPFHGLFSEEIFPKLVNLEEISLHVLIKGYELGTMDKRAFGSQWGAVDRILAPFAGPEDLPPYERLRRVSVRCEVDDSVHWDAIDRMLKTKFTGLRKLEERGLLELILQRRPQEM